MQNFVIFGVGLNWFLFFSWRLQSVWNCRTSNFCWTSYFCLLLVSISVLLFSVLRSQCFKLSLINPRVVLSHIGMCDLSGVEVGICARFYRRLLIDSHLTFLWSSFEYCKLIHRRWGVAFFYPKFTEVCPSTLVVCQSCQWVVVRQFFVVIFLCGLADRDIHQGILRSWPEISWGLRTCHVWWCYAIGL